MVEVRALRVEHDALLVVEEARAGRCHGGAIRVLTQLDKGRVLRL